MSQYLEPLREGNAFHCWRINVQQSFDQKKVCKVNYETMIQDIFKKMYRTLITMVVIITKFPDLAYTVKPPIDSVINSAVAMEGSGSYKMPISTKR